LNGGAFAPGWYYLFGVLRDREYVQPGTKVPQQELIDTHYPRSKERGKTKLSKPLICMNNWTAVLRSCFGYWSLVRSLPKTKDQYPKTNSYNP
jgi:hypothetical protein